MDCRGMSSGGIELILPGIFGQLSSIEPPETRRESDESRLRNGDGQPIEVEVRTESRHQLTSTFDFTPLVPHCHW